MMKQYIYNCDSKQRSTLQKTNILQYTDIAAAKQPGVKT